MAADSVATREPPDPRWFYGFLAGMGLWYVVALGFSLLGVEAMRTPAVAVLVLLAWALMPVGVYFDAQTVAAEGFGWQPDNLRWALICSVWFVNLPAAAYYLYKRSDAMGGYFALSGIDEEGADDLDDPVD